MARDKLLQIVRYEAEQNVPFPINEVVWDYQLIGGHTEGDINVLLVAVKVESVAGLTGCVEAAKLEPEIVDAAPMALCNAVCFNYPGLDGCTMLLDIGARSANLIFVEQHRVFSRSVPVAGNAITQEICKQFGVSFKEAEQMKLAESTVALGGVTAGSGGEEAERISKIVRMVFTRLHAEVNRSVNFYRTQQGGSPPSRVLLAGGASIIPQTDTFFREKLKVPVEYFNPFANVTVSDNISEEQANRDFPLLGEVVGLALRRGQTCPLEINLMPPEIVARKVFRKRQPFFAVAAAGIVAILLCLLGYTNRMRAVKERQLAKVSERVDFRAGIGRELKKAVAAEAAAAAKATAIADVIVMRTQWIEILDAIHGCMLEGMWLREIMPVVAEDGTASQVDIKGRGFDDKLRAADVPSATAIEVFRDKLRESPCFTEKTDITREPPGADYARQFTIRIELTTPLRVR